MTDATDKIRAALEYSGTLIKFCVKPEKCVTRGDIKAGTDEMKSALQIYKEIQEALSEMDGIEQGMSDAIHMTGYLLPLAKGYVAAHPGIRSTECIIIEDAEKMFAQYAGEKK